MTGHGTRLSDGTSLFPLLALPSVKMSTLADEFLADLEEDDAPPEGTGVNGGNDAMQMSGPVTVKKEKIEGEEDGDGEEAEAEEEEDEEDDLLDEMVVESTLKLKSVRQLVSLSEQNLNQLIEVCRTLYISFLVFCAHAVSRKSIRPNGMQSLLL